MPASRLRLAAFDLDGTLLDSANAIVEGVRACWDACGFPAPDPQAVRRIIGLPWDDSIRMLIPGAGEEEFTRIRAYHDEVARGVRPRPPSDPVLFPGAVEALDALEQSGYLLAIITSRSNARLKDLLDRQAIGGRFIALKTTDHGPGKPNPHLMLQTLAETGVAESNAVMVGDTTFDVLMARNAGTAAVGVSWGVHGRDELSQAGAAHVVDAFQDILPTLARLTGG